MLDWLFGGSELPEGFEIRSDVSVNGYGTRYYLYYSDRKIAEEDTYLDSHRACLRRLRKAARLYAKNGVVPR